MMLIPEAWQNDGAMDATRKDFYRFHRCSRVGERVSAEGRVRTSAALTLLGAEGRRL